MSFLCVQISLLTSFYMCVRYGRDTASSTLELGDGQRATGPSGPFILPDTWGVFPYVSRDIIRMGKERVITSAAGGLGHVV